jgi:hypothetical protein
MRHSLLIIFIFSNIFLRAQDEDNQRYFNGTVLSTANQQPLVGANIVNLTSLYGTSSDENGLFDIKAKVNDSIIIAFMGYKTLSFVATEENLNKHQTIYLVETPLTLDEVVITSNPLTGDLKIDINLIPIHKRIDISPKIVAMFGDPKPNALSNFNDVMKKIMNPVDLIYNIFSTKSKDMRRLKKIQKEEKVREILASKFDREILSRLLKIDKKDVYLVLEICDYSESFINNANDLQILEAILNCYSKYDMYFDQKRK